MSKVAIKGLSALMIKLEKLGGNVDKALEDGIDKVSRRVKRDAKLLSPLDTGRLRNSIQHKVTRYDGNIIGRVFTNVEYAPYVEFGTGQAGENSQVIKKPGVTYSKDWKGQPAQPYLYPALIQNKNNIEKDLKASLSQAIKEVCR